MTWRAISGTPYQREAEVLEGLGDVVHVVRVRRSGSGGSCTSRLTHEGKESDGSWIFFYFFITFIEPQGATMDNAFLRQTDEV